MSDKKPQPVVVKFKYPAKWGEQDVLQIELKRPKGKHIKHIGASPTQTDLMKVAVKICDIDVSPAFFDELDVVDYLAVGEAVADFLDDGPETGKTP